MQQVAGNYGGNCGARILQVPAFFDRITTREFIEQQKKFGHKNIARCIVSIVWKCEHVNI